MKIGYLLEKGEEIRKPPFNGPAHHVRQVALELMRLGHEVTLLSWLDGVVWVTKDLKKFRSAKNQTGERGIFDLFERGTRKLQSVLKLPYLGWFDNRRFAKVCEQELSDCDIFLERMSWIMAGGAQAAQQLKIPLVLEYNGDPLADLEAKGIAPQGLQRRISVKQMRRVLHSASRVVATGDGWAENCTRVWGVAPERITTIENGTDLVGRLSREQLRCFREETPGATLSSTTTLVYLGGFYAWHGLQVLLEALPMIVTCYPQVRLVLIGSGPGEAETRRKVENEGLSDCVEFLGQLSAEEYAPILADADIGLSPYCGWPEFSGLKIFDYKAAGLPVIASGVSGMPRSVRDGETGLIVPPCDVSALAKAVLHLTSNPQLRLEIGRKARIEAETLHSWSHTARSLEQVFNEIHPNV